MSAKVQDLTICYIGGGSRGWAWGLMSDLATDGDLSGRVKLYDINFQAALDNAQIGNRMSALADAKGKWVYEAVPTLAEALQGADFVIISILPGSFDDMESDVHAPEAYGIFQSVGDTTGPGGLVRALRTIPMYVEFAQQIREHAPKAWVINYTNPMSLCVRTLYEVFPDVKAFGCCHEVFGTQELLVQMLRDAAGTTSETTSGNTHLANATRQDIRINVSGINHFTWITEASYQGIDLFPLYRDFVNRYYDTGFDAEHPGEWEQNPFLSANRVKFDLFRRYGIIAAAGDRHLAEFVPWYLTSKEAVRHWKFGLTPVSWRKEHQQSLRSRSQDLVTGAVQPEIQPSGEEGLLQVKALLGLGDFVTNLNLPNRDQAQGLPLSAVVETNALITRDGVRPVLAGVLPTPVQNLVTRHALNYETILQAAIAKDKELAFAAFVNDPLVKLHLDEAWDLFNTMLQNTRNHLPDWDI